MITNNTQITYVELTRSEALASRPDGSTHYLITDQSFGRLGAVNILMHAGLNEAGIYDYSQAVSVYTTFDNTAWSGMYDIDANQITFLQDNRVNKVYGSTNVNNFDWGNTRYSNNTVYGTLTTTDNQNAIKVDGNTIFQGANVNITGATGTLSRNEMAGNFSAVNGNINFTNNTTTGVSTINGVNLTSIGCKYGVCNINLPLTATTTFLYYGTYDNQYSLTRTGGATGQWNDYYSNMNGGTDNDTATGNKQTQFRSSVNSSRTFTGNCNDYFSYMESKHSCNTEQITNSQSVRAYYNNDNSLASINWTNIPAGTKQRYACSASESSRVNLLNTFQDYYSNINSVSTYTLRDAFNYGYGNEASSNSSQIHRGGNKWRVSTECGYQLNSNAFAVSYYKGEGSIARSLTGANTNRAERISLLPI